MSHHCDKETPLNQQLDSQQQSLRSTLRWLWTREEEHAAVNAPLITSEWLQKLRNIRLHEIKSSFQEYENVQRIRNARQAETLRSCAAFLQALQAETEAVQASHNAAMESILQIHENRLRQVISRNTENLNVLASQLVKEREESKAIHQQIVAELSADITGRENDHKEEQKQSETVFQAQKRELKELWDERCGLTRLLGEEKIKQLTVALTQVTQSTEAATKDDKARYQRLLDEERVTSQLKDSPSNELAHIKQEVVEWRERLERDAAEWQKSITEAEKEKKCAFEEYTRAQRRGGDKRRRHEDRMKAISAACGVVESELEGTVALAEKISKALRLSKVAHHEVRDKVVAVSGSPI